MTHTTRDIRVWYSHCVKFTPGKFDQYPWSDYQSREITVRATRIPADPDIGILEPEWQISCNGIVLAIEVSLDDAIQIAQYELMSRSRNAVSKNT